MKVAVVGSGISGLTASWLLQEGHDITLFEAENRLGGHTHTVEIPAGRVGGSVPVDTGFIVFNRRTYPLFCRFLHKLNVDFHDSDMGFSVQVSETGKEYCGRGLKGLFAQRRNLFRLNHWRMIFDLFRFYRLAPALLEAQDDPVLGDYLRSNGYSEVFIKEHLIPMAAAVWSSDPDDILRFPARTLIQFFFNHGFLAIKDRPNWLTVSGGSRTYIDAWKESFAGEVRISSPVLGISRVDSGVLLTLKGGNCRFDHVVLATHADTSLQLLDDACGSERDILSSFRFQENEVVLHQDPSLMPKNKSIWSAWNYDIPESELSRATVTYWMNCLQGLDTPEPLFVTLNRTDEIDPSRICGKFLYDHPVFDRKSVAAQGRHEEIDGKNGISFCGAYWRYGFHEDGVWSAARVASRLGVEVDDLL